MYNCEYPVGLELHNDEKSLGQTIMKNHPLEKIVSLHIQISDHFITWAQWSKFSSELATSTRVKQFLFKANI